MGYCQVYDGLEKPFELSPPSQPRLLTNIQQVEMEARLWVQLFEVPILDVHIVHVIEVVDAGDRGPIHQQQLAHLLGDKPCCNSS
jgi:hypothetical protein